MTEPIVCDDCEREVKAVNDYWLCESCEMCRNERAWEASLSDFYGGDGPVTLDEQLNEARKLK